MAKYIKSTENQIQNKN